MEELRKISASEIARHTSKKDCWLLIHGKVYDVTKFLADHPGGEEVLVHASGNGDATHRFEDVGHSSTARKRMTSYLIGVLEGYDPSEAPQPRDSSETRVEKGAAEARVQLKPPFGISDYLLPLFLLLVGVIGYWFMQNDGNNTA